MSYFISYLKEQDNINDVYCHAYFPNIVDKHDIFIEIIDSDWIFEFICTDIFQDIKYDIYESRQYYLENVDKFITRLGKLSRKYNIVNQSVFDFLQNAQLIPLNCSYIDNIGRSIIRENYSLNSTMTPNITRLICSYI